MQTNDRPFPDPDGIRGAAEWIATTGARTHSIDTPRGAKPRVHVYEADFLRVFIGSPGVVRSRSTVNSDKLTIDAGPVVAFTMVDAEYPTPDPRPYLIGSDSAVRQ